MADVIPDAGDRIGATLDRLVAGLTTLSHDGRFDEPNLDGTAAIERWQQAIERAPFTPPPTGRIEQAALPRPTHLERRNAP